MVGPGDHSPQARRADQARRARWDQRSEDRVRNVDFILQIVDLRRHRAWSMGHGVRGQNLEESRCKVQGTMYRKKC